LNCDSRPLRHCKVNWTRLANGHYLITFTNVLRNGSWNYIDPKARLIDSGMRADFYIDNDELMESGTKGMFKPFRRVP
jgi:hypothetical protein